MGERWFAHCHQKFYGQRAYNEATTVVLSLGAILPPFLHPRRHVVMYGDIFDCHH